ncbi:MAG TPA: DUF4829 domain-containing protein [Clostridia bacterium]|nr:DUF4829 domain-containing protein [Clostridia bacterium]
MKRLLVIILIILTLIGCKGELAGSPNLSKAEGAASNKETMEEEIHILPMDITIDDQKEVEELINDYFNALEHRDYLKSWELMSTKYRSGYKDFEGYNSASKNSIIESIKLIEIKGYIPPFKTKEFVTTRVPEGVPTVWFEAYFDLKLTKEDPSWVNGKNERFVNVEKEDNIWKIGGLATSP